MIEIGINPNTKQASVAIVLHGYFGLGKDGIKLVDQDTVFEGRTVKKAGELPISVFDTLQEKIQITNDKQIKRPVGNPNWRTGVSANPNGRPKGTTKTPLADLMKEVAQNKHYKIKETGETVVAYDLIAEMVVDEIIHKKNHKYLETFLDRTEGKVTQGVKLSGGLSHGKPDDEEMERLLALFPKK